MTNQGTASTLILIGAIIQLLFSIGFLTIGLLSITFTLALIALDPFLGSMVLTVVIVYFVFGLSGLLFVFFWFRWRSEPSAHRMNLLATSVLGLLFAGVLPGLLVFIGGILTPHVPKSKDLQP